MIFSRAIPGSIQGCTCHALNNCKADAALIHSPATVDAVLPVAFVYARLLGIRL